MKIVTLTMVNNESEIIESFIRYNYNFVDEMVMIDNGCTDNTIAIIRNLIEEGYKIVVFDESLEVYNQFRLDNKYLQKIIHEMNPDIILPLDADEFLIGDENPRKILEGLSLKKVYYIHWQWYVLTEFDDPNESFIPRRMQYCLKDAVWNYSDGTVVTKVIIPAKYYENMKLTLSMGHHTVFGNDNVQIEELKNLRLAHFRAISKLQLVSKTCCYTMRDIATMENNVETAQRTNQMALIEHGSNMWDAAVEASYGGYTKDIIYNPVDLSVCKKSSLTVKYKKLAEESLAVRILKTGQEMAVRAYNLERAKKEKLFLEPIIVWMDGTKGKECILPDPSNSITIMAAMYNVRGYLTICDEIKFLKENYRLIVTPDVVKFIPYRYIVIPKTVNFMETKTILENYGIDSDKIISQMEYKKKLGLAKNIYAYLFFVPSAAERVCAYMKRNGVKHTILKIKQKLLK